MILCSFLYRYGVILLYILLKSIKKICKSTKNHGGGGMLLYICKRIQYPFIIFVVIVRIEKEEMKKTDYLRVLLIKAK